MTHLKRLIAVFIIVLTAFLIIPKGKAKEINYEPFGESNSKAHFYDDVNEWQEKTYTTKYLDALSANEGKTSVEDKRILEIIPLDILIERGTHIHIGLKYGFFVQTQMYDSFCFYEGGDELDKVNLCEIFIFKIERKINQADLTFETMINPVLSTDYVYHWYNKTNTYKLYPIEKNDNSILISHFSNTCQINNYQTSSLEWENQTHFEGYIDNFEKYAIEAAKSGFNSLMNFVFTVLSIYSGQWDLCNAIRSFIRVATTIIADILSQGDSIDFLFDSTELLENSIESLVRIHEYEFGSANTGNKVTFYAKLLLYFTKIIIKIKNYDKSIVKNLSDFANYISPSIDDLFFHIGSAYVQSKVGDVSIVSAILSLARDSLIDSVNLAKNTLKCLFGGMDFCKSDPNYTQNYFGYKDKSKYQLICDKKRRCYSSIFNKLKTNSNTLINNTYVEFNTSITFYDGDYGYVYNSYNAQIDDPIEEDKYYTIDFSYTMKINNTLDNVPMEYEKIYTNKSVFYTNGQSEYIVYFTPKIDGIYTFTVKLLPSTLVLDSYYICEEGSSQKVTSLKKNKKYVLTINGNAFSTSNGFPYDFNNDYYSVSIDVTAKEEKVEYSGTSQPFDCTADGWYNIEINQYYIAQRQYYLDVRDVYYKVVCGGTYYSYTRKYSVSSSELYRENNWTFKVYLKSGYTYHVDYYCTGSSSITNPNVIKIVRYS